MKKGFALLVSLVLLVCLMGTALAETVTTIRFVGFCAEDTEMGQAFYPLLDKWLQANPDIKVESEYVFNDDLKAQIKTEAAADMLPDVMVYWGSLSNSAWLYAADMLVPTEQLLEDVDVLKREMFDENILKSISYNGTAYGIPLDACRTGFFINKEVFEACDLKLPSAYDIYTYDQWQADGKVMLEKGYTPLALGWKGGNPGHYYLSEIICQLPGGIEEMNGLLEYKNPAGSGNLATAIGYIQKDVELGMYPVDYLNFSWSEQAALFNDGKAGAIYTLATSMISACNTHPGLFEKIEIVDFPQIAQCVNPPSGRFDFSIDSCVHVSKTDYADEKKHDAIVRFLNWFYGEEWMSQYVGYEDCILNLPYDIPDENYGEVALKIYSFQQGKDSAPFYLGVLPDSNAFTDYKNLIQEAAMGTYTPAEFEEAAKAIFDEMEKP